MALLEWVMHIPAMYDSNINPYMDDRDFIIMSIMEYEQIIRPFVNYFLKGVF